MTVEKMERPRLAALDDGQRLRILENTETRFFIPYEREFRRSGAFEVVQMSLTRENVKFPGPMSGGILDDRFGV